ncbi:MAG: transglycosylase SLT domain-containing protein [Deltaproteobacteria bacterium]
MHGRLFKIEPRLTVGIFTVLIWAIFMISAEPARAEEINCLSLLESGGQREIPRERYAQGYCSVKTARFAEALTVLAGLERELPLLGDYAIYYRGVAHSGLLNFPAAEAEFSRALAEYPDSALRRGSLVKLAELYAAAQNYPKAEGVFRALFADEPDSASKAMFLNNLAEALERQGKGREAADAYKRLWVELPESPLADGAYGSSARLANAGGFPLAIGEGDYLLRGERLYKLSRWAAALKNFESLSSKSKDVRMKTAICNFNLGRYGEAEKILSLIPSAESLFWAAKIKAKQGRDIAAAESYYQIYLLYPDSPLAAEGIYIAARLYQIASSLEKAIELYDQLIRKYPGSKSYAEGAWNLGWIHYKRKSYPEAIATFNSIIASSPGFEASRASYWKGKILERQGRHTEALAIYDTLARANSPTYYSYLAQVKTGYAPVIYSPELSKNASASINSTKAELLIELGIFEDADLEIKKLRRAAGSSRDTLHVACLMARVNNFYDSIALAQGIDLPEARRISYPKGFGAAVKRFALKHGLDELLAYSIIREESRFDRNAVSRAGAIGLMQLMPATGRSAAGEVGIASYSTDLLYTPLFNIELGVSYLKKMLDRFEGNLQYAVGSYNAGPGNMDSWIVRFAGMDMDEFAEEIPFSETRAYVRRVLRSYGAYKTIYGSEIIINEPAKP